MSLIVIESEQNRFLLRAGQSSYAFQVGEDGLLVHLHWGGLVECSDDLPSPEEVTAYRHRPPSRRSMCRQEYPGWGGAMFTEPALKCDLSGGVRNTILKYQGYSVLRDKDSETLMIMLLDDFYPLEVTLFYRVYSDAEVIDRWSETVNRGDAMIKLESVQSACWQLPRRDADYRLTHLAGRWGKEGMLERVPVTQAKITLESRTGLSGHLAMPLFALDRGEATEDFGRVWFGTLQWSGNWKMAIERDAYEQVSVCGGINDFDFSWSLPPGEKFTTPIFTGGYTDAGFGEVSRMLHRYQRRYIEPENQRGQIMPLIYNSYSALGTGERMNVGNAVKAAELAARIGAELFVVDAGWQQALGDWLPHPVKFPHGLKPLIDRVNELGMDFGIWVEIEAVDINSNLHREHPEWVMAFPNRPVSKDVSDGSHPNRLLLNFARSEVMEYMYSAMYRLLSENRIVYLKLDMNRYFTNPGWEGVPEAEQRSLWVKYVKNLYELFGRLRRAFPELLLENCAAGNGRSDLAMNRLFGRVNRSDNQDTLDILRLHEGFTWLHQSKTAGGGCHISDFTGMVNLRRTPMQFQAFAGMLGSLAVGKNLPACSEEELTQLKEYGDLYKKLRLTIQLGEFYRLVSHYERPYAAFEYVSVDKKEAVLFVFGHSMQFAQKVPALQLRGLDPRTVYGIEIYGNNPQPGYTASIGGYAPMSGQGLAEIGVRVELLGDFDARILHFKAR